MPYFAQQDELTYCCDINGLFKLFDFEHKPEEWRLFIDSSKSGLKAVLLHNGNMQPSVPIAYSVTLKETYTTMSIVLDTIKYNEHKWQIVSDLKVVAQLTGLQGGNVKYPCFLCRWDSRDRANHYVKNDWEIRSNYDKGKHNLMQDPLVESRKIIIPPLHIKLGLIEQFVKTLPNDGNAINHLQQMFPKLSSAKVKSGVFIGPDIDKILKNYEFKLVLSSEHLTALKAMEKVITGFLGNYRDSQFKENIKAMIDSFEKIKANMSLKVHFLRDHVDDFVNNLGAYSEQHGERFHQDIASMEKRYSGGSIISMLSDHCWFLIRESADYELMWKRNAFKKYFNKNI